LALTASSGLVSGTPTASGSYLVAVTATDSYGSQASQSYMLTVSPASPGTPVNASVTPLITNASQSHPVWSERNARTKNKKRKHKHPIGTTFAFTLNEQASVSLTFTHTASGREVDHHCVAPTRKNRRRPGCKRTVAAGTLSFTGQAGPNAVPFQGRVSRSTLLRPGRYMLTIVASQSGKASAPATLNFTIANN
jgi:hypothetical protein